MRFFAQPRLTNPTLVWDINGADKLAQDAKWETKCCVERASCLFKASGPHAAFLQNSQDAVLQYLDSSFFALPQHGHAFILFKA
jgi:hypothetical protein